MSRCRGANEFDLRLISPGTARPEVADPAPSEKWATKDAPVRYSSAPEAADGNRRLASGVTFEAVSFPVQVQRLMKLLLEEDRRFSGSSIVAMGWNGCTAATR
jgi:hypothetical protein